MAKNKILVTGGCGYIGSHTIIELLEQTSYDVISVDNCVNSSADTMDRIRRITGRDVKNYNVDLCDLAATERIFQENPDLLGVIHFAALKAVGDSVFNPLGYYHNNLESQNNVLRCCEKYGVDNFIFSSSCSVYGNVKQLPVNEDTPLGKAESPYAYTKQIGESMIRDFVRNNQVKCIALRYFNPVGAHVSGLLGENPINKPTNLVPVITQTAIGIMKEFTVFGTDYGTRDGSCVRDYIHVTDIANAHVIALNYLIQGKNSANYEILNLGSGNGVTVLEAIHAFQKVTGIKPNYKLGERRPGDVEAIYSDTSLTEKKLGWKPRFNIDDMMESAWKWQLTLKEEKEAVAK